ncbi:hypothetical protein AAMO2058_001123400 [Amorphochlora amoebiformis]
MVENVKEIERQGLLNGDDRQSNSAGRPNEDIEDLGEIKGYWTKSARFASDNWVPLVANSFEWFEFASFAYLVDPISQNFANGNKVAVWFIFSLAFICRPLGGIIIGLVGDKMGRKPAFWIASVTVIASTVLQGALPSSRWGGSFGQKMGLAGLLILRITQGLGIGGEMGSGIVYLAESSPRRFVGMTMAWLSISGGAGFLLASFFSAMLRSVLTEDELLDWGWRLPFLVALIPGIIVLDMLSQLQETPEYEQTVEANQVVQGSAFVPRVIALIFMCAGAAAFWYVGCVYIFDWIMANGLKENVMWIAVLQNFCSFPAALASGFLTDHMGLEYAFKAVLVFTALVGLPMYMITADNLNYMIVIIGPGILFGFASGSLGVVTALLSVDLFPPILRHRSVGLGYNLSLCIFGGLGPAWVQLAESFTNVAGAYFLLLTSLTSLLIFVTAGQKMLKRKEFSASRRRDNSRVLFN